MFTHASNPRILLQPEAFGLSQPLYRLQRGMNFGTSGRPSIILMSRRPGAPYDDRIEEDGRVLIYEGHDTPQTRGGPDPKTLDQPERDQAAR